jgi:phosphate uptake regulator
MMVHGTTQQGTFSGEVSELADEVAGLGILAMEAFKNAAAALFDPEHIIAHSAIQVAATSVMAENALHQRAVAILARWAPTGGELKRIVNLQRTAMEYAHISEHSKRAAEYALALPGTVEQVVHLAHDQASPLLVGLVRQVYVALRGSLVVATTQNRTIAGRLIVEDAELGRLYQEIQSSMEGAVATRPQRAVAVRHVLSMLLEFRQIGARVVAICEDWL